MEQLMNQYTGLVYAVVKSKLDDSYYVSSDIEDCVADVFSKFYAELSDYDPKISNFEVFYILSVVAFTGFAYFFGNVLSTDFLAIHFLNECK